MMEKATSPYTLIVALTYNDDEQSHRDAAAMFAYVDVQDFMRRLRAALWYENPGQKTWVRFIVAGEQGDRNNRCHWHLVLYSSHPLPVCGQFQGFKPGRAGKGPLKWPEDRECMISGHRRKDPKRRLDWSIWGKGFVTIQEADEGGMHYVLSYAMKDQFTAEKSRDTGREAKSETFATGLFRPSKRPAIGEAFMFQRLAELDALGQCLPSLNLKVPGMRGYYHPTGRMRKQLLWGLVALNQRVRYATGRNAPQWSTLLNAVKDNQPDLEVLLGPEVEDDDAESVEWELAKRQREFNGTKATGEARRNCGAAIPCAYCLNGFNDQKIASLGLARFEFRDWEGEIRFRYESLDGFAPYQDRRADKSGGEHPDCQKAGSKANRRAFPASGAPSL